MTNPFPVRYNDSMELTQQLTAQLRNDKRIKFYTSAKDWYKESREAVLEYVKANYHPSEVASTLNRILALIAVTSPRVHVKRNLKLALEFNKDFEFLLFTKEKHIESYRDQWVQEYGIMPITADGLIHYYNTGEVKGPKVSAFYQNLIGNEDAVTIDVWVMRYFGFKQDSPTARQRQAITDAIRKMAPKYKMTPAQLQAVVWTIAVTEAGRNMVSFADFVKVEG